MALIGGLIGGTGGNVGSASVALLLNTSQFDSGLSAAEGRLRGTAARMDAVGRKMSSIGGSLTRGVSVPLALVGAAAGKMALDYENAFTRIAAISNASSKDIAKWKEQVKELATATGKDPQELAEALFFLSSAGLKSSQVMDVLEQSAKAAASGLGETKDIANITASAMNAYAKDGLKAAEVTNTLVAAVREGRAEPEEFAVAMGRILPIASKAGVGFDEIAASLAGVSNIGLDVNEGVTAMRGLLGAIVAPGTQAKDTLKEVGLTAEHLRTVLAEEGLIDALRLMEERTNGDIDAMRKIVPNIRAMTGAFGLTTQEAAKVDEIFGNVAHSTGDLNQAFDETAKGPGFAFQQALAKLKVAAIDLGTKLIPIATKIAGMIGDWAAAFSRLSPAMQENIVKWGAMAIALGPFLRVGGSVVTILAGLSKGLGVLGGAGGAGGAAAGGAGLAGLLPAAGIAAALASVVLIVKALADAKAETRANAAAADDMAAALRQGGDEAERVARFARTVAEGTTGNARMALLGITEAAMQRHRKELDLLVRSYNFADIATEHWAKATLKSSKMSDKQANNTLHLMKNIEQLGGSLNQSERAYLAASARVGDYNGVLEILHGKLEKIAGKNWEAKLTADVSQAKNQIDSFISTQSGRTITLNARVNPVAGTVVRAQHGFEGTVSRPTMFLAGEGGTSEHVSVRPSGHGRAHADRNRPTFVLNFNAPVMGSDVGAIVEKALTDRILKRGALV